MPYARQPYETWIDIDLASIEHNVRYLKNLGSNTDKQCILMVKANAYGHGLSLIGKAATQLGIDMLGITNAHEATLLRKQGVTLPLLLVGDFNKRHSQQLAEAQTTVTIGSWSSLEDLIAVSDTLKIDFHIKINTGLNRFGFNTNDMPELIKRLQAHNLIPEGIYTHYSHAGTDLAQTREALHAFRSCVNLLHAAGYNPISIHASNSAGAAWLDEDTTNTIRLGLAAYGLQPSRAKTLNLRPALSWRTRVSAIRHLARGDKIGYDGTWTTARPTQIAIIPVGYANGLRRGPERQHFILGKGRKYPIVGTIMMNHAFIDIGMSSHIAVDDVMTIVGEDGEDVITCETIADQIGTINEEVVTTIDPAIPRLIHQ